MQLNRIAIGLLAFTAIASAQRLAQDKHFIRASADAVVTGKPDRAQISIGVQTHAPSAKAAAEQNAAQTAEVIKKIKSVLGAGGEIRTTNYSISPHYEMDGGRSRQQGYETSNNVEVTVDDLSLLPQLLDASSGSGANTVGGISFSIKDDSALRLQALGEASTKAKAAAESIAHALNLQVSGVASAESGSSVNPIRPMPMMMAMAKSAPETPIESGTLEIRVSVTVTLEVK